MTALTAVAMDTAMQLQHLLTASHLVKTVNILCDYRLQLSHRLQFSKGAMGIVWLCMLIHHFMKIKVIKLFGMLVKEITADHSFRAIGIGLFAVNTTL